MAKELDLADVVAELCGVSALLLSLADGHIEGKGRLPDNVEADALNVLRMYIDRITEDVAAFEIVSIDTHKGA